jgi:hypothetical protein
MKTLQETYFREEKNLIYYHGSPKRFEQFSLRPNKRGKAIFLTDSLINAQFYGKFIYTVAVDPNIKLFDFQNTKHIEDLQNWVENYLIKQQQKKDYRKRESFHPFTWNKVLVGIKEGKYHFMGQPIITKALKSLKFDGWYEIETGWKQLGITNLKKLKILKVEEK